MHPNQIKALARQLMIDGMPRRTHYYRALRNRLGDERVEHLFSELDAIEERLKSEIAALTPPAKEERRD